MGGALRILFSFVNYTAGFLYEEELREKERRKNTSSLSFLLSFLFPPLNDRGYQKERKKVPASPPQNSLDQSDPGIFLLIEAEQLAFDGAARAAARSSLLASSWINIIIRAQLALSSCLGGAEAAAAAG